MTEKDEITDDEDTITIFDTSPNLYVKIEQENESKIPFVRELSIVCIDELPFPKSILHDVLETMRIELNEELRQIHLKFCRR